MGNISGKKDKHADQDDGYHRQRSSEDGRAYNPYPPGDSKGSSRRHGSTSRPRSSSSRAHSASNSSQHDDRTVKRKESKTSRFSGFFKDKKDKHDPRNKVAPSKSYGRGSYPDEHFQERSILKKGTPESRKARETQKALKPTARQHDSISSLTSRRQRSQEKRSLIEKNDSTTIVDLMPEDARMHLTSSNRSLSSQQNTTSRRSSFTNSQQDSGPRATRLRVDGLGEDPSKYDKVNPYKGYYRK